MHLHTLTILIQHACITQSKFTRILLNVNVRLHICMEHWQANVPNVKHRDLFIFGAK